MSTSNHTAAARVRNRPTDAEGAAFRPRRLATYAAIMAATVALAGCTGPVGSTLTAADLQQDAQAPWQVAGPAVAAPTRPSVLPQCDRTFSFVDDCDPSSVRYEGP